jgi:hypothetical protein
MDKVDSGHIISLLTPRISVLLLQGTTNTGGALWCHRSHMCQNAVDASRGGALLEVRLPCRRPGIVGARAQENYSTPAMRSVMEHFLFLQCANIPSSLGHFYSACKRGDASNSAVVTCDADMSCLSGHGRLSESQSQELHISAAQSSEL